MMMQKRDPYTKVFSTLSQVRVLSYILSQLNILCTSLVNHTTVKMMIRPLFTVHTSRHFMCSAMYWISSRWCVPYIKMFNTLSGVRIVFWILLQLDTLCTSAMKPYYAKNDNSPFKCHLFSHVLEFMEARKTCHWVVWTSVWSISYSRELCNKNYIVRTSESLIIWSACCYTAGSSKWDTIQGVPDRLLKRAAMMFRIHSRHVELLLTYWCS